MLFAFIGITVEIAIFLGFFLLLTSLDEDYANVITDKTDIPVIAGFLLASFPVLYLYATKIVPALLLGIIFGSFLTVLLLDKLTTQVSDWLYIPIYLGGIGLMICNPPSAYVLGNLVIFLLAQIFVFKRFYGFSDVLAFSGIGIVTAGLHGDLIVTLTIMIFAYAYLIIVQAFRKNINRKLRLEIPVAFLPYVGYALLSAYLLFAVCPAV